MKNNINYRVLFIAAIIFLEWLELLLLLLLLAIMIMMNK